MAGIMNKTARQYNLKCIDKKGRRVTVRLAPGFNVVDDEHWRAFVKGKKVDPYVKELKAEGSIDFGQAMDDLELEQDPDTKSKSKAENPPPTSPNEDSEEFEEEEEEEEDL